MLSLKMKVNWPMRRNRTARWATALAVAGAAVLSCAEAAEPIYLYESLNPEGLRDALRQRRTRMQHMESPALKELTPPAPSVSRRRPIALTKEVAEFVEIYTLWARAREGHGDAGWFSASREVQRDLRAEADLLAAELREIVGKMDDRALLRVALQAKNFTEGLLEAYLERAIEHEVERVIREPVRKLGFPADPVKLPDGFSSEADSTREAERKEYSRAMAPFARLATDRAKKDRVGEAAFQELDDAFWRGDLHDIAGQMLEFTSVSLCGTVMDEARRWMNRQLVLSLLRERKVAEALGASLRPSWGPEWMGIPGQVVEAWRFELAKYCGFDEETLLLGMEPSGEQWDFLAANASVKGARACMTSIRATIGQEKSAWVMPWRWLAEFLPPGSRAADSEKGVRARLPNDVQLEILDLLAKAIGRDVPFVDLDKNLAIFANLRREETKPLLRDLLSRPSRTFAEKAAVILRGMGEEVPKIKPALPVRLQFSMNGQRLALQNLGPVETDEEGLADLPRDFFIDPANGKGNVVFWLDPQPEVLKESNECAQWFVAAARPAVDDFGQVIKVELETCEVPLEVEYPRLPPPHVAGMRLTLTRVKPKTEFQDRSYEVSISKERPFPTKMRFTAVSPGTYEVAIEAPGSLRWQSEPIEVGRGMPPYHARLEQGTDLYASVFVPENALWPGSFELWRDGVNVAYTYRPNQKDGPRPLFAGLPKGKYELRSRSSEEIVARDGEQRSPFVDPRRQVKFESVAVPVTIDESTPAILDLGRIDVLPVAADREKATATRQVYSGLKSER